MFIKVHKMISCSKPHTIIRAVMAAVIAIRLGPFIAKLAKIRLLWFTTALLDQRIKSSRIAKQGIG